MFIRIQDVPHDEQHLLFCTDPALRRDRSPISSAPDDLEAINRSLAICGEAFPFPPIPNLPAVGPTVAA